MPISSDTIKKMKAKYKAKKQLESLREKYPHNFDKVIKQFERDDPPSLPIFCCESRTKIAGQYYFGTMHIQMQEPDQDPPPKSLAELFKLKNEEKLTVMNKTQKITSDLEIITRCKQALGTIENFKAFADKYPAPGDLEIQKMAELNQLEISPENWSKITKNKGNENWPLEIQIVIENSGGDISFRIPPNTVKNEIDEAILEQVAEAAKKPELVTGVAKKPVRSVVNLMRSAITAAISSQPDDVTKKCIGPQLIDGDTLMQIFKTIGEQKNPDPELADAEGVKVAKQIESQIEKAEKKYKDLIEIEKKPAELASQEPDPTPNLSDMNWKVVEKKQSITRRVRGLTSVTLQDVNNPGNEITIRMSKKEAEASKFTIGKTVNHFDLYECNINKITHGDNKVYSEISEILDPQLETLVESHKSPNKPGEGSRRSILGRAARAADEARAAATAADEARAAATAADEARAAATAAIRQQALTEEKNSKLKALGISSDLWDERDSNEIIIEIVNKTTIKIPPNDKPITLKEKTIDALREILNFDEAYAREELKEMIANPRDVKATFELIDRITSETPDVGKGLIQENKLKEVVQNGYQGKEQVGLKTSILNYMVTNAKESYAEIVKIDDQLEQIEVDNNRPSTLSH